MSRVIWYKLFCVTVALITFTLTFAACPAKPESTAVPVVEIQRKAPNTLDLPGTTETALAVPGKGAFLVNTRAKVWVPRDAITTNTAITITKFLQSPAGIVSTDPTAVPVTVVSNFYDLGPEDTVFNKPVTVTLAYSEQALSPGADENLIGPVYWDGINWMTIARQIDTAENTITFETRSFPGFVVFAAFGCKFGVTATAVLVSATATAAYSLYNNTTNQLVWGQGYKYVTPNDPTVISWAERARIRIVNESTTEMLVEINIKDLATNPKALKAFTDKFQHAEISFDNPANSTHPLKPEYVRDTPLFDNMQKPADYFNGGLKGDCEDISVAVASIFRHYGYPVKVVDGSRERDSGGRGGHAWAEIVIDGRVYYLGEWGTLVLLDTAITKYKLEYNTPSWYKGFQWDENNQEPYQPHWWVNNISITLDTSKAFPGGQVVINVATNTKTAVNIELTVEDMTGKRDTKSLNTKPEDGTLQYVYKLNKNFPEGTYIVEAFYPLRNVLGAEAFTVHLLEISAEPLPDKVPPGGQINIGVQLNFPVVTDITVEGSTKPWRTTSQGFVFPTYNVPKDAQPGEHSVTISAAEYGISYKMKYIVFLPPGVTVDIQPETAAPGDVLIVNVRVSPPGVTTITVSGYEGRYKTDKDGFAFPLIPVPKDAKPGTYKITVDAPDLKLSGSDTYTVAAGPLFNIGTIGLTNNIEYVDTEGTPWSEQADWGGNFITGQMVRQQFSATGRSAINELTGDVTYIVNISDDFSRIISGTFSFAGDRGERVYFKVTDIIRDRDSEARLLKEQGITLYVYTVSGTSVSDHLSSFTPSDPNATATYTGYTIDDESIIIIVLGAVTDKQRDQLQAQ